MQTVAPVALADPKAAMKGDAATAPLVSPTPTAGRRSKRLSGGSGDENSEPNDQDANIEGATAAKKQKRTTDEGPKEDAPKADDEAPKEDAPKADDEAPKEDAPKADDETPKEDTPKADDEAPKEDAPKADEAPKEDAPKADDKAPKEDTLQ